MFKQIPTSDTVVFYTALCMSELKQDAGSRFQAVAKDRSSVFRDKAKYYLLLLNIRDNHKVEAKKLLKELQANKNHPYHTVIRNLSSEAYFVN